MLLPYAHNTWQRWCWLCKQVVGQINGKKAHLWTLCIWYNKEGRVWVMLTVTTQLDMFLGLCSYSMHVDKKLDLMKSCMYTYSYSWINLQCALLMKLNPLHYNLWICEEGAQSYRPLGGGGGGGGGGRGEREKEAGVEESNSYRSGRGWMEGEWEGQDPYCVLYNC